MQVGRWIGWMMVVLSWGHTVVAQTVSLTATKTVDLEQTPFSASQEGEGKTASQRMLEMNFLSCDFLALTDLKRFAYINPMSSETSKDLYSQNLVLVMFATATRGNSEPFLMATEIKRPPYQTMYVPNSSTSWYVGDRLFAVDNSAFFGIEFDSSFAYRGGVVRVGDSSEKAVVILVSLYPSKK